MVAIQSALGIIVALAASQVLAVPISQGDESLAKKYLGIDGPVTHEELAAALNAAVVDTSGMLPKRQGSCTNKVKRKAWHTLTNDEKTSYLRAEVCLMWKIPSKSGLAPAKSRFDDLVITHQMLSHVIHGDGWFLPWHRLHMHAHERLLREECGYTGGHPYWDEEYDAGMLSISALFDPVVGFGGSGTGPGGCIQTGPFAGYMLRTGPGYINTEHCITRTLNDLMSWQSSRQYVEECLATKTFEKAWHCIEGRPHGGGHGGVGGEMMNPISSPGDPIFYMHHTFIDRLWWRWQERNLPARLKEIAGFNSLLPPLTGYVNATLDDELSMVGVIPNARISELMDIGSDLLCYEYV